MISVTIIANLTLIVILEGLKLLDIISIKLGFASTLLIINVKFDSDHSLLLLIIQ